MNAKYLLIICLLLWNSSLSAQEKMSLDQAIQYAHTHSLKMKNALIKENDATQLVKERRAIGLPQVNGKIDYQYYFRLPKILLPEAFEMLARDPVTGQLPPGWSRETSFSLRNNLSFGITANSLLFDATYLAALKAAKAFRQFAGIQRQNTEKEIRDAVREAYLPPLLLKEMLLTINKNIANLEKVKKETAAMYKEGFVEQLDVDRLTLSLANLYTEKDKLLKQQQSAINYLKLIINFPLDEELLLSDDILSLFEEATKEDLQGSFPNDRPEWMLAEKNIQLLNMDIERHRRGYLPSLAAFASYSYGYQGDKFDSEGFWLSTGIVGAQVNVPIFDGFDKQAKIQRAKLNLELARNQKQELHRAIELELRNARIQYQRALDNLQNQEQNVNLAQNIYDITQIKYREGVGSSLETSLAEQSLFQSQQNYTLALYDLLIAKIALDKALGK